MDDLHAPTVSSGPTSRSSGNGPTKMESLQELAARKEELEAELYALGSVLDSHGVNMHTSLTTFDGYPRADIDVAQVRMTRARIIRLRNDHKAMMEKLERVLHEHFASGKTAEPVNELQGTGGASSERDFDSQGAVGAFMVEPPFARVNAIEPRSPADQAGMKAGDKITNFGGMNWANHQRLGAIARVVQQNEGVSHYDVHHAELKTKSIVTASYYRDGNPRVGTGCVAPPRTSDYTEKRLGW